MGAALEGDNKVTLSPAAKNAIHEQLDRLLASTYFSHSKRFPIFLRFVVEQTLAGDADEIKERTLGIEIFGKDADYDTAADPIVRVTAAEIRKRVAQYYQEPAHQEELRITLPSGSYVPHFQGPKGGNTYGLPETESALAPIVPGDPAELNARSAVVWASWRATLASTAILILLMLAVGAIYFEWQRTTRSGFEFFWKPVLTSNEPVLLCIADQLNYSEIALRDATEPTHLVTLKDTLTAVIIDDLNATVKVAGILQSDGKPYSLRGEGATTLDDLRRGPTVFVGAFDNAWTLRLTNPLRFHFANDADMTHLWIADSTAPGRSNWTVDRGVQMATNIYRDYAIVARFTDGDTGKVAVVTAGIGRGGTRVAGEFLTDN